MYKSVGEQGILVPSRKLVLPKSINGSGPNGIKDDGSRLITPQEEHFQAEAKLAEIGRYGLYEDMMVRSSVLTHTRRAVVLYEDLRHAAITALPNHRPRYTRALIFCHDHLESEPPYDVPLEEKIGWTPAQRDAYKRIEREAIPKVMQGSSTTLQGFSYRGLLEESVNRGTVEYGLVKLVDVVDALGECLREIALGNFAFLFGRVGGIAPIETTIRMLRHLPEKHPHLIPVYHSGHPLVQIPTIKEARELYDKRPGYPAETGISAYDRWQMLTKDVA